MYTLMEQYYYEMLGLLAGKSSSESKTFLQEKGSDYVSKMFGIDELIFSLMELFNKYFMDLETIKKEDLYTDSYSRALMLKDDFYFSNKDGGIPYFSKVYDLIEEFHDSVIRKYKYKGDKKYFEKFKVDKAFKNLSFDEYLFVVTFAEKFFAYMGAALHLSLVRFNRFGELMEPKKEIVELFNQRYEDAFTVDIDEIRRKYTNMKESDFLAFGNTLNMSFSGGYDLYVDTDKEIVIIPKTIDGTPINSVKGKYVSETINRTKCVIILGDVNKLYEFATDNPNITKLYIDGDIKHIGSSCFIRSTKIVNNFNGATYLKTETNPYYALRQVLIDEGKLTIPETTVTIYENAFNNKGVDEVELSNVKYISMNAFINSKIKKLDLKNVYGMNYYSCMGMHELEEINLVGKLKTIPSSCFINAEKVKFILFPNNIERIETDAFKGCIGLEDLYFTNENVSLTMEVFPNDLSSLKIHGDSKFEQKHFVWGVSFDLIKHTFIRENALEAFNNRNNIFSDDDYSEFVDYDTDDVNNVSIISGFNKRMINVDTFIAKKEYGPYKVDNISYVFNEEDLPLKKIHFKGDIRFLDECFENATMIEEIRVDGEIKEIYGNAFSKCESLKTIENGVVYIKVNNNPYYICAGYTFGGNGHVVLHPSCFIVRNEAFRDSDIKSINFSNVKYIGNEALIYCNDLESVIINDTTISLGENGLALYCPNIKTMRLSNNIKQIICTLVSSNDALENIELPKHLEEVGSYLFDECSKLKDIKFPNKCFKYGWTCINSSPNVKRVYVPKGSSVDNFTFEGIEVIEY